MAIYLYFIGGVCYLYAAANAAFSPLSSDSLLRLGYFACFYSLSQAMQLMIPGVAYSFWCGMGVVFITVVGAAWYGQKVTLFEKTGIGLIVTGTLLMGFA